MDDEPRTRRIIYFLEFELVMPPDTAAGRSAFLYTPLDREGRATGGGGSNGMPRPPKGRTIDLRAGDYIMVNKQWREIKHVRSYREFWVTEEAAAKHDGHFGYLVRPAV